VNEQKLAELPLNGRNYLDLTLLQPGISQNTVVIQLGGGAGGTIYSSNGAPIISNNFLLDGTPTQNVLGYNGASAVGTTLGLDGIREYKVITNAFSAEYGMNMGSQMTIVSKGGSNQFHGDVFEYLRNRVLDARNFFDYSYGQCLGSNPSNASSCRRSPPYQRNNFGGAFGGPIQKDKTFFWGVYEGLRQVKGNPVIAKGIPAACVANGTRTVAQGNPNGSNYTVTPADCGGLIRDPITVNAAIRPLLALYDPADTNYTQLSHESVNFGQMRVNHNFGKGDSLFARYTIEDSNIVQPGPGFGASVYGFKEFQNALTSRSQFITLSENHIFSPTLLNTARISFSRTNPASAPVPDAVEPLCRSAIAGQRRPIGVVCGYARLASLGARGRQSVHSHGDRQRNPQLGKHPGSRRYARRLPVGEHALPVGTCLHRHYLNGFHFALPQRTGQLQPQGGQFGPNQFPVLVRRSPGKRPEKAVARPRIPERLHLLEQPGHHAGAAFHR